MANETTMNPASDGDGPVDTGRRKFLTATTAVVGAVGVGFAAVPFIKSWNPSERAKQAGAPVSVDITALQDELDRLREQPTSSPEYAEAQVLAAQGLNAEMIAARCGITLCGIFA